MFPLHRTTPRLWLYASFILLLTLLTACNGTGTPSVRSSKPISTLATSVSSTHVPSLKTYPGTNFRLTYPSTWQAQGSGNQIIFQDAQGLNALTIIITPNPGGQKSANSLADTTFPLVEKAILTDAQSTQIAPTVSVAGETWVQRGATGTLSTGGQSVPGKLIMLVVDHPAQTPATLAYEIYYGGPSATFEQITRTIFQVMLQSFKFTA